MSSININGTDRFILLSSDKKEKRLFVSSVLHRLINDYYELNGRPVTVSAVGKEYETSDDAIVAAQGLGSFDLLMPFAIDDALRGVNTKGVSGELALRAYSGGVPCSEFLFCGITDNDTDSLIKQDKWAASSVLVLLDCEKIVSGNASDDDALAASLKALNMAHSLLFVIVLLGKAERYFAVSPGASEEEIIKRARKLYPRLYSVCESCLSYKEYAYSAVNKDPHKVYDTDGSILGNVRYEPWNVGKIFRYMMYFSSLVNKRLLEKSISENEMKLRNRIGYFNKRSFRAHLDVMEARRNLAYYIRELHLTNNTITYFGTGEAPVESEGR